ncbi:hypothetical protein TPSD3_09065 [Thioflexithrix psekupsensis]|uniref:Nitrogen fixation protein NifQ n=2 Tax=Thioflexithrix psekupsensis TaxID=1570016 RepID=A0A251X9E3_9GAMM|nr:hypothetical protein TPSD3_09065 [Thioflexithrix psekupsensis]
MYAELMIHSAGLSEDSLFAMLIASGYCQRSCLPKQLGLCDEEWTLLLKTHFPTLSLPQKTTPDPVWDLTRMPEMEDLRILLQQHRRGNDKQSDWLTTIVIYGCLGQDHLWQDLGLWSRRDLSALFTTYFPELAAKNNRDMKWKKFLYKQLCEQEGIYVCRAPSCEVCADYSHCFGKE